MSNQRGPTNYTWFPIITPPWRTQDGVVNSPVGTYNMIIIEHEAQYISSDTQFRRQAPKVVSIYMFTGAATNQTTDVLSVLNPWMASAGGFDYIGQNFV